MLALRRKQADKLLQRVLKTRGFVEDFHQVLASRDRQFLKQESDIWELVIKKNRLGPKTTSLVRLAVVSALGNQTAIGHSIDGAVKDGATQEEVLDVLKIVFLFAGVPTLVTALAIFKKKFGA